MKVAFGIIIGIAIVALAIGLWVAKKALLIAWAGAVFGVVYVIPFCLVLALIGWIWYKVKKS